MKYFLKKNLSLKKNKLSGGNQNDPSENLMVKTIPNMKDVLNPTAPSIDSLTTGTLPNNEIAKSNNKITEEINDKSTSNKITFMQKIRNFFKSEFYFFMKDYLYFIVLISICFHILININKISTNKTVTIETKVLFYLIMIFIFIIINDILETPLESLKKFILVIIVTIILIYSVNHYVIEYYQETDKKMSKTLLLFCLSMIIFIITLVFIYFVFQRKDKIIAFNLYASFNSAINNNFSFLVFTTIFLCIYKSTFYGMDFNTQITDILCPSILGGLLIFYIMSYIIYICSKLKIINNMQYLNTYIALSSICFFLFIVYIKIFMSSLGTVCDNNTSETKSTMDEEERVSILIFISIIAILWLDDTRNWHQMGSIIFLLVTVFAFYCIFYYSTKHPSTGFLSFWLFIEWMIIIFYKKENTKNSIHYSFMNV